MSQYDAHLMTEINLQELDEPFSINQFNAIENQNSRSRHVICHSSFMSLIHAIH